MEFRHPIPKESATAKPEQEAFDPMLTGICATPPIIMMFGLGAVAKIIMTVLAAVFPILINTMAVHHRRLGRRLE